MEFERIRQIAYLDVENTNRYRRIMQFCYLQNLTVRSALYRDEIFEGVKSSGLLDYDEEKLEADLNYLVENGNLTRRQEMNKARSIEEFKNKHFRYQITATSIALEHLMTHLPKESIDSGDLNAHLFDRLFELLEPLHEMTGIQLADQWEQLVNIFQEIQQAAALYVNYLTSVKVEQMMQTAAFLTYKADFIHYLQIFIRSMQQTATKIQGTFKSISGEIIERIIDEQFKLKQTQPNLEKNDRLQIKRTIFGQFQTLKQWFVDTPNRQSEYHNLIQQTTNALDRVTRVIQSLTENMQQQRSRTKDYRQLVNWFLDIVNEPCEDDIKLRESNQLAAAFFSFGHTKHVQSEPLDISDQMLDLWCVTLPVMTLTSKSRHNRRSSKTISFTKDTQAAKRVTSEYKAKQTATMALWQQYLATGRLELSDHQTLPKEMRHNLLQYFSLSLISEDNIVLTNFGVRLHIIVVGKESTTIEFEDGTLEVPNIVYEIINGD